MLKILHIVNQSQLYAQLWKNRNISIKDRNKIRMSSITIGKWWGYNLKTNSKSVGNDDLQESDQQVNQFIKLYHYVKSGLQTSIIHVGKTNYEYLDLHIYLLFICIEVS